MQKISRNTEHYQDPTAGGALRNVHNDGRQRAIKALIKAQDIMQAEGFRLVGDLEISEPKTKTIYYIRGWNRMDGVTL